MSRSDESARVPLSIVLMTVGLIVVVTAGGFWMIDQLAQRQQTVRLVPTAAPLPTTPTDPTPQVAETAVALLPETPSDVELYPDHFVSALEAAEPYAGQPVRIVIPAIELDAPVSPIGLQAVEAGNELLYQWMVPAEFKAGWHNTSARLGQPGNTVLNGHHNIWGEVFRDLDELEEGAEIVMYDTERPYTFTVSQVLLLEERGQSVEVRQENAQWIAQTDDERLTLVTCWPYTDNTHRLIIVADPVDDTQTVENGPDLSQSAESP